MKLVNLCKVVGIKNIYLAGKKDLQNNLDIFEKVEKLRILLLKSCWNHITLVDK